MIRSFQSEIVSPSIALGSASSVQIISTVGRNGRSPSLEPPPARGSHVSFRGPPVPYGSARRPVPGLLTHQVPEDLHRKIYVATTRARFRTIEVFPAQPLPKNLRVRSSSDA